MFNSLEDILLDMKKKSTKPGELTMRLIRQLEKKYGKRKKENMSEHIDKIVYGVERPDG
jgi:hypothetical protein